MPCLMIRTVINLFPLLQPYIVSELLWNKESIPRFLQYGKGIVGEWVVEDSKKSGLVGIEIW